MKVKVDAKLAGLRHVETTIYVANKGGEYLAFGHNTKQTQIEWDMTQDHSGPAEVTKPKKAN